MDSGLAWALREIHGPVATPAAPAAASFRKLRRVALDGGSCATRFPLWSDLDGSDRAPGPGNRQGPLEGWGYPFSLFVQATSSASSFRIRSRDVSSVSSPRSLKRCAALAISTSGWLTGYMLRNTKHWRRWYWARALPRMPTEAPMTATGLPCHALSPYGREAQSIAFLSTPGIE